MFGLWGNPSPTFDAAKDIPDLSGKVILVTGGNTGLGKQYILDICRHRPAQVWMAARSVEKAETAISDIRSQVPDAPIHILELDLSSLASVKAAAQTFREKSSRLDILMLNAGLVSVAPGLTEDGYEIQFGTNYVGHALLAKLLLPTMEKTMVEHNNDDARVVVLSSMAYKWVPAEGIKFDALKTKCEEIWGMARYGQSKLAGILWARQLAREYPNIKTASVHPGAVRSDFGRPREADANIFMRFTRWFAFMILGSVTCEVGVKNQLWASFSKDIQSGEFYMPIGVGGKVDAFGKDDELAKRLWDWTEEELKAHVA